LAFDAAVLDGDVVVLDLIHVTQPMTECRNEIRMDPALRLEEPDRRLLRGLGERPSRPPRRDMNSRRSSCGIPSASSPYIRLVGIKS
jgi:hypothetical protein